MFTRHALFMCMCLACTYTPNNFYRDNNYVDVSLIINFDSSKFYGVPFSHLFTELQISAIELEISANQLNCN